ncbi:hypothetical protein [Paenibacillus etheri]|uniref:Sugar ABC transporter substrate-binding protein n=1 Tax=Paenibacillus etheri TaxID=1306852 RepID=A0A0W1AV22_9BACL|nr:hypothetical protein [Paenibacillus etheri]KTD85146.1 hypothetical protein UQ64_22340 [Paenibacillus etheri]
MRNKLFSLSFVMIMILSSTLAGCGSNNGNSTNNAAPATDKPAATNTENTSGDSTSNATAEPAAGTDITGKITFLTNRTDMIGKEYDEYLKRFNEKYPNASLLN